MWPQVFTGQRVAVLGQSWRGDGRLAVTGDRTTLHWPAVKWGLMGGFVLLVILSDRENGDVPVWGRGGTRLGGLSGGVMVHHGEVVQGCFSCCWY